MSDMLGQGHSFRVGSDVEAVELLARYALRLARVAVLRRTSTSFRDFRAVNWPGFLCRLRLIPFDQTGARFDLNGNPCPHPSPCLMCGAPSLLRLELQQVRPHGSEPDPNVRSEKSEPSCVIHIRNRHAAEPLSPRRQRGVRRTLKFQGFKRRTKGRDRNQARNVSESLRADLRVRTIYVGAESTADDLKAQMALTLLQARIFENDSPVGMWFMSTYLVRFLDARMRADRGVAAIITADSFRGLWENWGDQEWAQGWRPYVCYWVRFTGRRILRESLSVPPIDDVEDGDEEAEKNRQEGFGAVSSHHKPKRNVAYAVPRDEAGTVAALLSVSDAAAVLNVSARQVYRLVEAGKLRPLSINPTITLARDTVDRLCAEAAERRKAIRDGIVRIHREKPGLKRESVRKAAYRRRAASLRRG